MTLRFGTPASWKKLILAYLVSVHAFSLYLTACQYVYACTPDITFLQVSFPALFAGVGTPALP